MQNFEGKDLVFVQERNRSSVRGSKSIDKMTVGKKCCVSIPVNWIRSESQLCTEGTDLHHVTWRFEENNVRVLELNVSPKFAQMKQVVAIVRTTQPTKFSSTSKINKRFFELQISSNESPEKNDYYITFF